MFGSDRKKTWTWLFVCLVVTIVIFFTVVDLGFFSDDYGMYYTMQEQTGVLRYFGQNLLGQVGGHSYGPMFNILTITQQHMFGIDARGWHVVSLFAHAITGWLVYILASRLFDKKSIARIASLLFLLFPNRVEALAWVAVQPHIFATLFFTASLVAYQYFLQTTQRRWYVLSLIAAAMSLLYKEIGITFVGAMLLLFVYHKYRQRNTLTGSLLVKGFMHLLFPVGIIVAYLGLRAHATGAAFGYYAGSTAVSLQQKIQMLSELLFSFVIDSSHRFVVAQYVTTYWWAIIVAAFIILGYQYKRNAANFWVAVGLLMALLGTALPFLSLQFHPFTNEGDRYAYLLGVPVAIGVSWYLHEWLQKFSGSFARYLSIGLVLVYSVWSVQLIQHKIEDWRFAALLRDHIIASTSTNAGPLYAVGLPDNVNGAQVFRNAYSQAMAIHHDSSYIERLGDRVQIYTYWQKPEPATIVFDGKQIESTDKDTVIFTGFQEQTRANSTYRMQSFRQPGHVGESVIVEGSEPIWYFTGDSMRLSE